MYKINLELHPTHYGYYVIQPRSLLQQPFLQSYDAEVFSYFDFLQFFKESGLCEFSSRYGSITIEHEFLHMFIKKAERAFISIKISNKFYSPADYICRQETCNSFQNTILLVQVPAEDNFYIIPMLNIEHQIDLDHFYTKTQAVKNNCLGIINIDCLKI